VRGLEVLNPGLMSLVENRGRFGFGDLGITQSGAADRYSAALANRLLRNAPEAPVLEIAQGGVELLAHVETEIALTGAEAELRIGGVACRLWRTHRVREGERIEIGMARNGLRLYLAVAGGFEAPRWLGSASVSLRDRLGRPLKKGDRLSCRDLEPLPCPRVVPKRLIPDWRGPLRLRLLMGCQAERFPAGSLERLFAGSYRLVSGDRMGCRLAGPAVEHDLEILSEPIAYGAVQIPRDGQPIVLLNERQTIGGYPKVGAVLPMDCWRLAQAAPGTEIRFERVSLEEARRVSMRMERFLGERAEIYPRRERISEEKEKSGEES